MATDKAGEQIAAPPVCENCGLTRDKHWSGRPFCRDTKSQDGFSVTQEWRVAAPPELSQKLLIEQPELAPLRKEIENQLAEEYSFVRWEDKESARKILWQALVDEKTWLTALQAKVSTLEKALRKMARQWEIDSNSESIAPQEAASLHACADELLELLSGESRQ